jgi:SMC interacting uncharacterized protein involved in chromosome segregation
MKHKPVKASNLKRYTIPQLEKINRKLQVQVFTLQNKVLKLENKTLKQEQQILKLQRKINKSEFEGGDISIQYAPHKTSPPKL